MVLTVHVCVLFLFSAASQIAVIRAETVNVTVYYEALCMDSMDFLVTQFYPAYLINGDKINVDLVPFGKAKADNNTGRWNFTCQHGPRECYGNKVHSCAVALFPQKKSTEFIVCTMKSGDAALEENLYQCATEHNVSWPDVQQCVESGKADDLLAFNGIRTTSVRPAIRFVPTILFNDIYNDSMQGMALRNFSEVVDFLINQNCDNCKSGAIGLNPSAYYLLVMMLALVQLVQRVKVL